MLLEEIDSSYDLQTQEVATLQSLIIIDQSLTFQPNNPQFGSKLSHFVMLLNLNSSLKQPTRVHIEKSFKYKQ